MLFWHNLSLIKIKLFDLLRTIKYSIHYHRERSGPGRIRYLNLALPPSSARRLQWTSWTSLTEVTSNVLIDKTALGSLPNALTLLREKIYNLIPRAAHPIVNITDPNFQCRERQKQATKDGDAQILVRCCYFLCFRHCTKYRNEWTERKKVSESPLHIVNELMLHESLVYCNRSIDM